MSNIRSASNAWAALRKKIQERNTDPNAGPVLVTKRKTPAKAKATPSKRKKADPSTPNGGGDDDELIDPASSIKSGVKKESPADDDTDVQEVPASKRAKGKTGGRIVPPPAGLANPQGDVGEMTLRPAPSADEASDTPTRKTAAVKKAPVKPRAPRVKKEKAAAAEPKVPKATPKKRAPKSDAKVKQEDLDDDVQDDEAGDNSGAEILATAAAALQVVEANAATAEAAAETTAEATAEATAEDAMEVDGAEVKAEGGDEAGVV